MAGVNNLNLAQNIVVAGLQKENDPFAIYDISGGYQSLYNAFALLARNTRGGFPSNPEDVVPYSNGFTNADRRYYTTYLNDLQIVAPISNRVAGLGNQLVLTLTGDFQSAFRVGDGVMFGANINATRGRVVASSGGVVTIAPAEGATAFAATDFPVGANLKVLYDISSMTNSETKTSLNFSPDTDYNCITTMRDGYAFNRVTGGVNSLIEPVGSSGTFWQNYNINEVYRRMMKGIDRAFLYQNRDQSTAPNGDPLDTMGGIEWTIDNRNGFRSTLNTLMTRQDFENFLYEIQLRKSNNTDVQGLLVMGTAAFNRIRSFGSGDYVRYQSDLSGDMQNTLFPQFKFYEVNGRVYAFYIASILDDPHYFPERSNIAGVQGTLRSNDIYYLDIEPVPVVNKGLDSRDLLLPGATRPPVELIHWGSSPNDQPFFTGFMPGIGSMNTVGQMSVGEIMSGATDNIIVTDREAFAFTMMYQGGINMATGEFSGKLEYAQ
jgi:hypothetical protein